MLEGMTGEKAGLRTAVAASFSPGDAVPGSVDALQLPLLPLSQSVPAPADGEETGPAARGAGRPKGAQNRSTAAWRDFILSRYQSPLIALAETFSRPLADIARELGFIVDGDAETGRKAKPEEMLELLKVQLQCAKELAPYVHQRQPLAIDGGDKGLINLVINAGGATAAQVEDAGVMDLHFVEIEPEQNQGVSAGGSENSVAVNSVAGDKVKPDQSDRVLE
jgi:hypothetical protein